MRRVLGFFKNRLSGPVDLSSARRDDEVVYDNVQLSRLFATIRGGINWIAIIGLGLALSNVGFTTLTTLTGWSRDDKISGLVNENKVTIEANRKQAVGAAVANCAFQNIARNAVSDVLTRLELAGAFRDAPEVDQALDESRKELAPVECKAFAPKRDQINITLDYPTTIPPPP